MSCWLLASCMLCVCAGGVSSRVHLQSSHAICEKSCSLGIPLPLPFIAGPASHLRENARTGVLDI